MTRQNLSKAAELYEACGDEVVSLGRQLRRTGRLFWVFNGIDVYTAGAPSRKFLAKLHHDGQTLYLFVSTQFLDGVDYRVWLVDEEEPLDDSDLWQMRDSWTTERIVERFEEREADGQSDS